MVNTRQTPAGSSSDERLEALEKATNELNIQLKQQDDRYTKKLDSFMADIRAAIAAIPASTPQSNPLVASSSATDLPPGSAPLLMPTFDGTDALAWIARAEQYFLVANTTPASRLPIAMAALSGPALPWIQLLKRREPLLTWSRFTQELILRFGDNLALDEYEAFAAIRHDDSIAEYVAAFEARLANISDLSDRQYLGFFLANLRPDIRLHMQSASITSYSHAVQLALRFESLNRTASATAPQSAPLSRSMFPSTGRPPPRTISTPSASSAASSPARPPSRRFRNMSPEDIRKHMAAGTCFRCGLKFGPTHRCPPKTLNVIVTDDTEEEAEEYDSAEPECDESSPTLQLSELSYNGLGSSRTLKLIGCVAGREVIVMIDSGASHCFISDSLASTLAVPITATSPFSVQLGDGSRVTSAGMCHGVPLLLASVTFPISCYVFPLHGLDFILGVSWLSTLGDITANWRSLTMTFQHKGHRVVLQAAPSLTRMACSALDFAHLEEGDTCWFLRALEASNAADSFIISDSLSASQRTDVNRLLTAFPRVTDPKPGLPPRRNCDHRIPLLPGSAPVSVRPYRYNHLQKDEMEKLVAEMLASGIIQPSSSPFSSPVLLVRKKDGSWRFCVDYRVLNKRTVADKYPIPVIQELLDELHGARWFSKLDLKAGYHQIRVAPQDVHKTAFRTHSGHYEFLVMPFGLTNAPATFQCLMNDIFRPFLRRFVLVFFDDILVYSTTWAQHMDHLRQVFKTLDTNSLIVNPKKCLIGHHSVEYLGHLIDRDGVRMDPAKISAVLRWPTPTTLKGVRGFLGLTGYYRRFIKDYGKIAAPLTHLLKKADGNHTATRLQWTDAAQQAFSDLKAALTSAPLLRMPDFSKDFVVECDASGHGIGAVLMQENQPIAYFSKSLASKWLNKSAYEKELMALVLAIQHWRPYLLGRHFVVYSDQRSLKQLLDQPLTSPAQQNWAAKLMGYDFSVVYKEGKRNQAADALSRRDAEDLDLRALSRPSWLDWGSLETDIAADAALTKIRTALAAGNSAAPHYSLVNGTLLYKGRIVIPASSAWVAKLLAEFHVSATGGHSGAYRTYRRIASNFYWPGMMRHVTAYVAACMTCQRQKYDTRSPAGLLSPLPIPERIWEDISMDFLSGLPRSGGVDCILVVVDRLSKYGHFIGLRHPFSAKQVADAFTKEIVRLHGIPRSIVSDRDPIFLSSFWKELFRATNTKLRMSSAYHPETDGQTEVVNRCLQTYLRCFSSDRPGQWFKWLAWAEYCYNTSVHTSSKMTPFEVVYGRPPPTIHAYLPGEIRAPAAAEALRDRDIALSELRAHLQRAQARMVAAANKHRREAQFEVGDMVFLKFRPYRQHSLFSTVNRKLAPRFFGPFRVEDRIGPSAYRLKLPEDSRIHPVFHVSLLKKLIGDAPTEVSLPDELRLVDPPFLPERVLQRRTGANGDQVLIKWLDLPEGDATWMDVADVVGQFPCFSLEDKAASPARAIDTPWQVYTRGPRGVWQIMEEDTQQITPKQGTTAAQQGITPPSTDRPYHQQQTQPLNKQG